MRFRDRRDAGRRLGALVSQGDVVSAAEAVVLGLPRGGVPVAFEVARALGAPLDVIVVRKLGCPPQPELAMGAIGEGGVRVVNPDVLGTGAAGDAGLEAIEQTERVTLARRARQYRGDRSRIELRGRCAVVVDDGVATGSTARAACQVARAQGASRIVFAVPVGARQAVAALADVCDAALCLEMPDPFYAVGEWYLDFSPTTDEAVVDLLRRADIAQDGPPP
ncbi:MAG: phosphoribosyltransferase [Acidimicrobiales bacterium]